MNAARGGGGEQAVLEDREVEHRRAAVALDRARTAAAARRRRSGRRSRPGRSSREIPPLETPSTSPVRPTTNVAVPSRSSPRIASRPGELVQHQPRPRRRRASANGTLNQNTQCHEIATSAPPSTGPSTSPTAATIVFVPIARPSCSRGNASVTSAAALANRNAAPTPWRIRHRISSVPFVGEAGAERGEREDDEAADVGLLAAEQVGQPARGEHEHGRGDHVGEDHPHERRAASCASARSRSGRAMISVPELIVASSMPEAGAGERPPLVVGVLRVDPESVFHVNVKFSDHPFRMRPAHPIAGDRRRRAGGGRTHAGPGDDRRALHGATARNGAPRQAQAESDCMTDPLGPVPDWNIVVMGDLNLMNTDSEGRIVVGRDATLQNFGVASSYPNDPNRDRPGGRPGPERRQHRRQPRQRHLRAEPVAAP